MNQWSKEMKESSNGETQTRQKQILANQKKTVSVAEWYRQLVPNRLTRVRIPSDIEDLELDEAGNKTKGGGVNGVEPRGECPGGTAERWLSG